MLLAFWIGSHPGFAANPVEVSWEDLVPELEPYEDPFESLVPEVLYMLADVSDYRQRQEQGEVLSAPELEILSEYEAELEDRGIDTDELLAMVDEVNQKRMERGQVINQALDGRNVRIPGYMLPLEFRGKDVIEFLLVPWVGACIHTPPPPPNQIVHVKLESGYEATDIFTAVWIEGEITAQYSEQYLTFVDGSDHIPVSYTLDARHIELFE